MQQGRQQGQGRKQHHPDHEDKDITDHKVGITKQGGIDKRAFAAQGVHKKDIEADKGNDSLDDNLGGSEPVLEFASVEHHLERAHGNGRNNFV